jgi:hypothetical protein
MKDRCTFGAGNGHERGGGDREHGSSAKRIVTAATALGPWGGPVSDARPVDAADASASQGATAVFAREASRRVGCCVSPGGVRRRRNRTVERGSCGCRRRAASSRGDDHDECTASGPVQSTSANGQTEACGSFRHPGREVGADHALCPARRSCSGPGGPRAAAQDQAPDQGGSHEPQASGPESDRLAAVQAKPRAASGDRCGGGATGRVR